MIDASEPDARVCCGSGLHASNDVGDTWRPGDVTAVPGVTQKLSYDFA
jgi:hypothetical protein